MGKYEDFSTSLNRTFRNLLNVFKDDVDSRIGTQKSRVDDLIKGTPQPSEVVDARLGFSVLRDKLVSIDEHLAENATNPLSFGALGDNVQDDTQKILNAITGKKNNYIKLSKGLYKVTNQIVFPDDCVIEFEEGAKIIYSGSNLKAIVLGNNTLVKNINLEDGRKVRNSYGVFIQGKANIRIVGGTIKGFGFANIGFDNIDNIRIENVNSTDCGLKDDTDQADVNLKWYGQGIWGQGSRDVFVSGNFVKDNGMHGIQIIGSERVLVSSNNCSFNGDCGITINKCDSFELGNNICNNNGINGGPFGGQGIQMVGNSTTTTKDGTVTGNTTKNNTENGIEATTYCENISIDGNTSRNNAWAGIAINPNVNTVTVNGNVCIGNQNGISCKTANIIELSGNITNLNRENGISINTCDCVNVDSFISLNNGQSFDDRCGVLVTVSTNVDVKNGKAFDNQTTKTQAHGIRYYNSTNGECSGNTITGNKTTAFLISGSPTIVINNQDDVSVSTKGLKDKNGIRFLSGTGSPNSVVSAPPGSIYFRTDGNRTNSIYFKISGTSNTGWEAAQPIASGSTANRPTEGIMSGYQYFDTTLNKPIWWNFTVWVDSTGTTV